MKFSLNNDLDNKSLDKMKALIIDVLLLLSTVLNNENSKTFFKLLNLMEKAEEIATNLADRSFSHFFIIISNILPNYIRSDNIVCDISDANPFTYITTDQYLSDKFYEIMIDTSVFKYSTMDNKQFMAYTRDIKDTTIDIAKIGVIYI